MRRTLLTTILCFTIVSLFLSAGVASAHVLKVDGSIGSTLHVDPADNPVVGSPATFYFEIKDKQNKFTPEGCTCNVVISTSQGEVLYTEQLFTQSTSAGLSTPLLRYVFEKGGVYKVTLTGTPKTAGSFQNFQLGYDVRVENSEVATHTDGAGTSSDVWLYTGLGVLVLVVLVLMALQRKKKNKHISPLLLLFGVFAAGSVLLYSGHFFELATPAHAHHHIVGETGHADEASHGIAPHTMAVVAPPSFSTTEHALGSVVEPLSPFVLAFVPATFNIRAPPPIL